MSAGGPDPSRSAGLHDGSGAVTCDVLVIGAGMGGAAVAHRLRDSGASVLVVERGERLPREPENWDASEVFERQRYRTAEPWLDVRAGSEFQPGVHYHVGGNTKFYGACLPRFRVRDFELIEHAEGISAPWPLSYAELEPYYTLAEHALLVHGDDTGDASAPWRSSPYPFPAVAHEPVVRALADAWTAQGLSPVTMPVGIDLRDGGTCVRCTTCDGFPCRLGAKADAETSFLEPALESRTVRMMTGAKVVKLTTAGRTVNTAVVYQGSTEHVVRFGQVVLAAGAVNTAALLLRSAATAGGRLANSSGLVGRNYMVHNSTFFVAVNPRRLNTTRFQKTLGLNQWYFAGSDTSHPLGNVQMLGKLQAPMVAAARRHVPRRILAATTARSIDLYLTTEDLASTSNGVRLGPGGRIGIEWTPSNLAPHRELVKRMRGVMRAAGYPLIFTQRMGIETNSHMCGTAVMGVDPASSVVDPSGKAHDLDNLWVADSSTFPSSAALNPALTIAANALRVADQLRRRC